MSGQKIRLVWVAALAWILVAASQSSIFAQTTSGGRTASVGHRAAGPYYVEFRAARIGAYGHSYAVYGSVGGRPNYVDLHPMGNYAIMAVGHLLPVPANTEWDPGVLALPVASKYRKTLSADQYRRLLSAIQSAKANKSPYWNAVTNNCNHFIGELAAAIGLRVPGSFQVSYSFVPAMKELNEGANATTDLQTVRKSASPRS